MPCLSTNLYTAITSSEICSASTTYQFYLTDSQIDIGVTAYTDSLCSILAPNGYYTENPYGQPWGEITGGSGVFSTTGTCYSCDSILLASGVTSGDCCSATTFVTYYTNNSEISLNKILFSDSQCTVPVNDGFYTTNEYRPTWGQVDSGIGDPGEVILTGICYDCSFDGTSIIIPQQTSFVSCCNIGYQFNVQHDIGTFNVGEVYYLDTTVFSGCATVVEYQYCAPQYCLNVATLAVDCDDCLSTNSIICEDYPCEITCYSLDTKGLTTYDGQYCLVGQTYNNFDYYVGGNLSTRYIFYNGSIWCLSDTLGGSCLLFGNETCNTNCPDLCEELTIYACVTTTTNPCDIVDFDALFDCAPTQSPTPTPTPTPTITPTLTPTPTPTSTTLCPGVSISLSVTSLPGESPTPTPTPSSTPPTRDNCFSGNTTFNLINDCFSCPDGTTC